MSRKNNLDGAQRDKFLAASYLGWIDKHRIAKELNFSIQTAERRMKFFSLKHAKQQLIDIWKSYDSGATTKVLAEKFGVSSNSVTMFLKRHGVVVRKSKYYTNFDFFQDIDSEEKAYILGFIFADGCVHKKTLKISLAAKDINILEKIKRAMKSECPIKERYYKTSFGGQHTVIFEVTNLKLVLDLQKSNVTERKTETAVFPNISENMTRHFIRGYVDGDGSFGEYIINSQKFGAITKFSMGICGTPKFLQKMQDILFPVCDVKGSLYKRRKESKSCVVSLQYSGGRSIKKILNYLYKDASIYLDRKYENYLKICT